MSTLKPSDFELKNVKSLLRLQLRGTCLLEKTLSGSFANLAPQRENVKHTLISSSNLC